MLFPPTPRVEADAVAASYHGWNRSLAEIRTDNELFNLAIDRSAGDLRLLVNDGPGPDERYLAAGIPWFATLFGRDSIIGAFQALAIRPQLAIETLEVLARLQATEEDPSRDAEPGKIPHELRTGEMARAGELPHRPYYGTVGRDAAVARCCWARRGTGPATGRWSTGCGRTRCARWSGSTSTATATATGSWSTSAGRRAG